MMFSDFKSSFPQVTIFSLSQIPIVNIPNVFETRLVIIVTQILAIKKNDFSADTTALEAEIDQLVYQLYGLTEEEIKIVEESVG